MMKIVLGVIITTLIFIVSLFIFTPIMFNLRLTDSITDPILFSLTCTIIVCTMIIIEKINEIKEKYDDNKNE